MDSSAGRACWAWRRMLRRASGIENANLHRAGLGVSSESPHWQRDAYKDYCVSRIETNTKLNSISGQPQ